LGKERVKALLRCAGSGKIRKEGFFNGQFIEKILREHSDNKRITVRKYGRCLCLNMVRKAAFFLITNIILVLIIKPEVFRNRMILSDIENCFSTGTFYLKERI